MAPDIATRRLATQRLIGKPFPSAVDAVGFLGAVQSQDYAGAKWALGQRTRGATESGIDRLFDEGAILRTHVLRPTWHFVLPNDIRWLLELTGPRVKAKVVQRLRQLEIDAALLKRSRAVLERTLAGGNALTRNELGAVLQRARINVVHERLMHTLTQAELDGVLISGPRHGKQHTYALLEERVPTAPRLERNEALAELTRRYFTGHGPAQVQDFSWWSGLTMAEIRRGMELLGGALVSETRDGRTYWSSPDAPDAGSRRVAVHLLPNYDEFLVAYRDRSASLDPGRGFDPSPLPRASILSHVVVLNGQVCGSWRPQRSARALAVQLSALDALNPAETAALMSAADHLGRFTGAAVEVTGLPATATP
jgi:hypothetical protein